MTNYGSIEKDVEQNDDSTGCNSSLVFPPDEQEESAGFVQNVINTADAIFVPEPHGTLERRDSLASLIDDDIYAKETILVQDTFSGNASIPSEVANLVKNIIGCGVLSLSGGIAAFADSPNAVWSAAFWIVFLGAMFGYLCVLIGKVCQMTGVATYRELGILTMGTYGGISMSVCNMLKPALANLAYSTILSQTLQSLMETIGIDVSNLTSLILVTVVAILPLCLMKSLTVLAPFSVLGSIGIVFTAIAMLIRCFDGTYAPGGIYAAQNFDPQFGHTNNAFTTKALPFICMVYEAWVMHYNSPRFYTELRNASVPRFSTAVGWSFGMSSIVYIAIAGAGYWTFGSNVDSYVLNSYSAQDPLATACRLAVFISTLFNYPLAFIGFRDGVVDLLVIFTTPPGKDPPIDWNKYLDLLTVVLVTIVTGTAVYITDLGTINAVGGGAISTPIVFIFPAIMYRVAVEKDQTSKFYVQRKREVVFVFALMLIGMVLGFTGAWIAIQGVVATDD